MKQNILWAFLLFALFGCVKNAKSPVTPVATFSLTRFLFQWPFVQYTHRYDGQTKENDFPLEAKIYLISRGVVIVPQVEWQRAQTAHFAESLRHQIRIFKYTDDRGWKVGRLDAFSQDEDSINNLFYTKKFDDQLQDITTKDLWTRNVPISLEIQGDRLLFSTNLAHDDSQKVVQPSQGVFVRDAANKRVCVRLLDSRGAGEEACQYDIDAAPTL